MPRLDRYFLILFAAFSFDAAATPAQTLLSTDGPASRAALLDSVAHARQRWQTARPQRYRVRVGIQCECARMADEAPWVLVDGDSILRDSVRADQRFLVVNRPADYTIDGLFGVLEAALRDTLVTVTGVHFDPKLGFPLSFYSPRRCVTHTCIYGGTGVEVLGFAVVNERAASDDADSNSFATARALTHAEADNRFSKARFARILFGSLAA